MNKLWCLLLLVLLLCGCSRRVYVPVETVGVEFCTFAALLSLRYFRLWTFASLLWTDSNHKQ